MHWRRKWQPTPVFLPGESQGWEPGGLLSSGSHRVVHDWRDLAAAAGTLYGWNHTGFVLLWLAYFTEYNVFRVPPCCRTCHFLPFKGWVIVHCMDMPVIIHSSTNGHLGCFLTLSTVNNVWRFQILDIVPENSVWVSPEREAPGWDPGSLLTWHVWVMKQWFKESCNLSYYPSPPQLLWAGFYFFTRVARKLYVPSMRCYFMKIFF